MRSALQGSSSSHPGQGPAQRMLLASIMRMMRHPFTNRERSDPESWDQEPRGSGWGRGPLDQPPESDEDEGSSHWYDLVDWRAWRDSQDGGLLNG